MKKLICDGNEIVIKNYLECKDRLLYIFDMEFSTDNDFKKFLNFYNKYQFGNGIFHFEIDGKYFDGWLGKMMYDENYNVRLYAGIYDKNNNLEKEFPGNVYNVSSSLIGLGNAIRELCDLLNQKEILTIEQKDKIISMMNTPETLIEFEDLVKDLSLYLKQNNF